MESVQRKKFKSIQDWQNYLVSANKEGLEINPHELRLACYKEIEEYRKNPLLIYATSFIKPQPTGVPNSIDIGDVDGFTDMINSIDGDTKHIDILLHSPGGRPDATERIVNILRKRFEKVNFLIPHSAYSAATMLALSGDSIILHPSAILGPIDPQINGIPARSNKASAEQAPRYSRTGH